MGRWYPASLDPAQGEAEAVGNQVVLMESEVGLPRECCKKEQSSKLLTLET